MQSTFKHYSLLALLGLVGLLGPRIPCAVAQVSTYVVTPGFDRVKAANARLKQEGDKLRKETRDTLLAEGKAIVDLEQLYFEGKTSIQRDIKALEERIEAYNAKPDRTQKEKDELDEISRKLDPRIDADNKQLIARYAGFARNVEAAFLPKGRQPSFQPFAPLSKTYKERREYAKILVADNDVGRCAVVLSATLDLRPDRQGKFRELSLADLNEKDISPNYKGKEVLKHFYVRAQQLADRLERDWGSSQKWQDEDVKTKGKQALGEKRGVVFFEGGFGTLGGGNHIDLWDGKEMKWAAETGTTFEEAIGRAKKVRFWEIPD